MEVHLLEWRKADVDSRKRPRPRRKGNDRLRKKETFRELEMLGEPWREQKRQKERLPGPRREWPSLKRKTLFQKKKRFSGRWDVA